MNLEDAIKRAQQWEHENATVRPEAIAAVLIRVNDKVVYARYTEGRVVAEVWDAWDVIIAVEQTIRNAAKTSENPYWLWPDNRPATAVASCS